ncbi:MAG: hypothetical protein O7I42_26650 [Alphaproteobacteria bacterium]|nr:hypothetical protein [Alphaproteobacteria bacterium]
MARLVLVTFVSIFVFLLTPAHAQAPLTSPQVANFVNSVYAVHDVASKYGPLSLGGGGGQSTGAQPSGGNTGGWQGQTGAQPMAPAGNAAMQQALQQMQNMNISPEQKQMMLQMMQAGMQGQGAGMSGGGTAMVPPGTAQQADPMAAMGQMKNKSRRGQAVFTSVLEDIKGHRAYNEIRGVVRGYGYADMNQWAALGDRVMRAYIALAAAAQGGQFGNASEADKMAVRPHRASIKGWENLQ